MVTRQKNRKPIAFFHVNAECCLLTDITHIYIITWSWPNHSSFAQESAVWTEYNSGRKCNMLPSVATHSSSLSWCRSLCQKWELFFVDPEVKSQWTVLVGYLTISRNVSCY